MERVPTLIRDRTKVVSAKADRPKGAGLAKLLFGALMLVSHGVKEQKDGQLTLTGTDLAGIHHRKQSCDSRSCSLRCGPMGCRLRLWC